MTPEKVILKCENVQYGSLVFAAPVHELVLTNHKLVLNENNFWGGSKKEHTFMINEIKSHEGNTLISISDKLGLETLEIYFGSEPTLFGFLEKGEAQIFANEINALVAANID